MKRYYQAMINFLRWLFSPRYRLLKFVLSASILLMLTWLILQTLGLIRDLNDQRTQSFWQWSQSNPNDRSALVTVQRDACPGAPFILPADGFIGLLYGDPRGPYSQGQPHQGIDIFSNSEPGTTPVYAASDGFVTRELDWRSSLILRVPQDPFDPTRQLWLYYTHMADQEGNDFIVESFPPGTQEMFVEQGTLLGYTGDFNGDSLRTIWVHLHFSIVMDDGNGRYRNELDFANTLDPSPYLGLNVNYNCESPSTGCTADPLCTDT